MNASASDQLRRILRLIPQLADDKDHSLADVAAAVGIDPANLLSDLSSISDRFDAPGGFIEGVSIFLENDTVSVHANHFHRPMRLTMHELCSLELGLTMLQRERTPVERAPIARALERLRATISVLPSNDQHEGTLYADLVTAGSAEHLSVLRNGCRQRRKLRLSYRSGSATETSVRTICPHSLLFTDQMWYVFALCDDTVSRFFRLDRIEHVEMLAETFEPDETLTRRAAESRPFARDAERTMTVRYSPVVARWVAEREGKTVAEDGSLTLELAVGDDAWAIRHVLQYGPEAEILEPWDLRRSLLERLDSMQMTKRDGDSSSSPVA
jgi:proteasome accessory factor C